MHASISANSDGRASGPWLLIVAREAIRSRAHMQEMNTNSATPKSTARRTAVFELSGSRCVLGTSVVEVTGVVGVYE